jgi:hypothetical protein
MAITPNEAVENYAQKQRAKGFRAIYIWVPENKKDEVKEYARKLRDQHIKQKESQRLWE